MILTMDDLITNSDADPVDDMFIAKIVFYPSCALAAVVYTMQLHDKNDDAGEAGDCCLRWSKGVMDLIPEGDNYNPTVNSQAVMLASFWTSLHSRGETLEEGPMALFLPSVLYLYGKGDNVVADVLVKSFAVGDLTMNSAAEIFRNGNVMRALTQGTL